MVTAAIAPDTSSAIFIFPVFLIALNTSAATIPTSILGTKHTMTDLIPPVYPAIAGANGEKQNDVGFGINVFFHILPSANTKPSPAPSFTPSKMAPMATVT